MKKNVKLTIFLLAIFLLLVGCSKEDGGNSDVTATPETTPTSSVEQTPVIPTVNSSKEEFHVYSEQEKQEINEIAEKYVVTDIKTGAATIFILAYYEYYGMMDTKLPVVLSMSAEDAKAKYGEDWLELVADYGFAEDEKMDEWCYGILTAQQISDLLLKDQTIYAYVAKDDTVARKTVDDVDVKEVAGISSIEHFKIYAMRKDGDVGIYEKAGEYRVTVSMHSSWDLY